MDPTTAVQSGDYLPRNQYEIPILSWSWSGAQAMVRDRGPLVILIGGYLFDWLTDPFFSRACRHPLSPEAPERRAAFPRPVGPRVLGVPYGARKHHANPARYADHNDKRLAITQPASHAVAEPVCPVQAQYYRSHYETRPSVNFLPSKTIRTGVIDGGHLFLLCAAREEYPGSSLSSLLAGGRVTPHLRRG